MLNKEMIVIFIGMQTNELRRSSTKVSRFKRATTSRTFEGWGNITESEQKEKAGNEDLIYLRIS